MVVSLYGCGVRSSVQYFCTSSRLPAPSSKLQALRSSKLTRQVLKVKRGNQYLDIAISSIQTKEKQEQTEKEEGEEEEEEEKEDFLSPKQTHQLTPIPFPVYTKNHHTHPTQPNPPQSNPTSKMDALFTSKSATRPNLPHSKKTRNH